MDDLFRLAGRLDAAAATISGSAAALGGLHHDPAEFGAAGPGRVGELGRALHARWSAALYAREREASRAAAELAETAAAVRRAAAGYAEADADAARRLTREEP